MLHPMRRPVLLYACFGVAPEPWIAELTRALPELEIRVWPDAGDRTDIDYVLLWNYPNGFLREFPKLRAIFSMGAGVDQLMLDPQLPDNVPLVRMVDPGLAVFMREYVAMRVLHYHRDMPTYEAQQRAARWQKLPPVNAARRSVGVMGLGYIGGTCARTLADFGFAVRGWARTPQSLPGVTVIAGADRLVEFLAGLEILVCTLPLTEETRGILNLKNFSQLTRGAWLINVARGAHLVEADLIAALNSGQLAGATLDVFSTEPLPSTHPFWRDPRITITPHSSAMTCPETAAPRVALNIKRDFGGEAMTDVVNRATGY